MTEFKLCISDPKTGKTYQKEVKDEQAQIFVGMNIDETVNGEQLGASGYEFKITGGSDYCGFPMRHGILGVRKRISMYGGVGFRGKGRGGKRLKGMKMRKTVCGHKINENITQINLAVTKHGSKKLNEALGVEEKKAEDKDAKPAAKKTETKQKAAEEQPEKKAEKDQPKPAEKKAAVAQEPVKKAQQKTEEPKDKKSEKEAEKK